MESRAKKTIITVQALVLAPVNKVWECWTNPIHITHWNNASDDWHTPKSENDLRVGGKFLSRMEARDGSMGFDFEGEYLQIEPYKFIEYILGDGRKVQIGFVSDQNETNVTESFEAEDMNSTELQQAGWQAILDNFKKYAENLIRPQTLHFEICIAAMVEKVYNSMLDEEHYKEWTAVFNPTSSYRGSWKKGSKILFLGTDHNGNEGGMVSRISENIPNKFVSIEHLGMVQGGKEITTGPEVEGWAGAMENYTFTWHDGTTLLSIDMDAKEEFLPYFTETWPKALSVLKTICENNL